MRKTSYIIIIIAALSLAVYICRISSYTYVTAKFPELRPFKGALPVYYKGLVIGKAGSSSHSSDYNHTLIKLTLYPKKLLLPENTKVFLKKERKKNKERDFFELIYPEEPSSVMISNGATLDGITTIDVDTFMATQKPNDLEEIKKNLAQSTEELNNSLAALSQMFSLINEILEENKNSIKTTTQNLSTTTQNLAVSTDTLQNLTKKADNVVTEEKLNNTISSVEASLKHVESLSLQLTGTIDDVNNSTLSELNGVMQNTNAITCGVRKTLRKKMGGLRLFFGQVIDECEQ